MEEILYLEKPDLNTPIVIIGFEGWPNAAEVSSGALQYLIGKLEAKKFASIPIEDFHELSVSRPVAVIKEGRLVELKREVLHLVTGGYKPPLPEKIYAAVSDALGAMKVGVWMMREGGYITDHELVIAGRLAHEMTGGEISKPTWVDEQYILDLEREAFLSLCGEEKTQQRMWNLLQTGTPLRNRFLKINKPKQITLFAW